MSRWSFLRTGGSTEASIRHFGTAEQQASLPLSSTYGYVQPEDYSVGCKIALLLLRRGELADKTLAHLREMAAPEPGKADWRLMIEHGRIARNEKKNRLELTPMGLHAAQTITFDLARKFGIHFVTYTRGSVGRFAGHSVRRTCGFTAFSNGGRSGQGNVNGMASRHMRDVANGTLPPAYRIPNAGPDAITRICNELQESLRAGGQTS